MISIDFSTTVSVALRAGFSGSAARGSVQTPQHQLPHNARLATRYLLVVSLLLLSGCDDSARVPGPHGASLQWTGHTMGTTYRIAVHFADDAERHSEDASTIKQEVEHCLEQINQRMSTYRADSELSAFNRAAADQWHPVSSATASVVAVALQYHKETNGALDVTVGPLMRLWGFGTETTSGAASPLPDAGEIRATRARVGSAYLQSRQQPHPALKKSKAGIEVDLSALAKGYAVDQLVALLKESGAIGGVVEIGGEVRTWGRRSDGRGWRIGIENPLVDQRVLARILHLETAALATSGDYRNFRSLEDEQLSHLIDPRTGKPLPTRQMSVSVCAQTCLEADALATALFLMGEQQGLAWSESRGVAAMFLVVEDGKITETHSSHFDSYLQ